MGHNSNSNNHNSHSNHNNSLDFISNHSMASQCMDNHQCNLALDKDHNQDSVSQCTANLCMLNSNHSNSHRSSNKRRNNSSNNFSNSVNPRQNTFLQLIPIFI